MDGAAWSWALAAAADVAHVVGEMAAAAAVSRAGRRLVASRPGARGGAWRPTTAESHRCAVFCRRWRRQ